MTRLLFSFTWEEGDPTVAAVCERFGFAESELDDVFGVIEIDPLDHLYSVLVDREAAERARGQESVGSRGAAEGPFANPPISPFGPPEE